MMRIRITVFNISYRDIYHPKMEVRMSTEPVSSEQPDPVSKMFPLQIIDSVSYKKVPETNGHVELVTLYLILASTCPLSFPSISRSSASLIP